MAEDKGLKIFWYLIYACLAFAALSVVLGYFRQTNFDKHADEALANKSSGMSSTVNGLLQGLSSIRI
jgi:hypothetical protein